MLAAAQLLLVDLPTSLVLLADDTPALVMQYFAPRFPLHFNVRVVLVAVCTSMSFLVCVCSSSQIVHLLGIGLCSLGFGLGESTLINAAASMPPSAVAAFTAGSGFSGLVGTATWLGLQAVGCSVHTSLMLLAFLPGAVMIGASRELQPQAQTQRSNRNLNNQDSFQYRLKSIKPTSDKIILTKFFLPLFLVYLLTFSLNHALLPHLVVKAAPPANQAYVSFFFCYQLGCCIGRCGWTMIRHFVSTVTLAKLQFTIWAAVLVHEMHVRIGWLDFSLSSYNECFVMMLTLGVSCGACYGSTFGAMQEEVEPSARGRASSLVSTATTLGKQVDEFVSSNRVVVFSLLGFRTYYCRNSGCAFRALCCPSDS